MFGRDAALLEDAMAAVAGLRHGGRRGGGQLQPVRRSGGVRRQRGHEGADGPSPMGLRRERGLRLPGPSHGDQLALLGRLKAAGKRVVTVLIGGRPYEMGEIDRCSRRHPLLLLPGAPPAAMAIAQAASSGFASRRGGCASPCRTRPGQLPVYYNAKDSYRSMAYYNAARPRYGFGRGLSYTAFDLPPGGGGERRGVSFTPDQHRRQGGAGRCHKLYLHRRQGVVTSRARQAVRLRQGPGWRRGRREGAHHHSIPRESLAQWDLQMRHRVLPRADRVVPV